MYFIIGLIFGSFFCVVSERWPVRKNFWTSRSCCPHCQRTLLFYELIPIVSFLLLRGKCRTCQKRIPSLYLFAELIYGLLVWSIYNASMPLYHQPRVIVLVWLTMAFMLSLTDIIYLVIDSLTLYSFTILLWLLLLYYKCDFHWLTAGLCLMIYLVGKHTDYIGEGDLLLFISWFPWLAPEQIHFLLLVASLSGILYYMFKKWIFKKQVVQIPFVPFLSIGLIYCLL